MSDELFIGTIAHVSAAQGDGPLKTVVPGALFTLRRKARSAPHRASRPNEISAWLHPVGQGPSETLALGSRGAAVATWQHRIDAWLDHTHRTRLTADGNFGTSTQEATSALQRARGLTPDGIVGPQTRHALAAALAGSR